VQWATRRPELHESRQRMRASRACSRSPEFCVTLALDHRRRFSVYASTTLWQHWCDDSGAMPAGSTSGTSRTCVPRPVLFLASVLDLRLWGWTRLGVVFAQHSMPELTCDNAIIGASCKSAALLPRHYSARLWVVSVQHSVPELAPNWGTVESLVAHDR
jgi:hypothetical protein